MASENILFIICLYEWNLWMFLLSVYEWHLGIFSSPSVYMNGICECFYYLFIWMASGNIVFIVCLYEWNLWMFLSSVYMNGIWEYSLYCLFIWMESVNVFFIAFCWIKMESVNVFFIVFLYEWFLWMFSSPSVYMNRICECFLSWLLCWMKLMMFSSLLPHRWRNAKRTPLECSRSWFKPLSGQTKVYAICICYFFAKHAALRGPNPNPTPNNNPNPNCDISIVTKWQVMYTACWLLQYLTSGSTKVDSTRPRTGWLWIGIMCPNREACLSADCYFFVLGL